MKVGFITWRFVDFDGRGERFAGGIETYLGNLADVCCELDWTPIIFQCANVEFKVVIDKIIVIGVRVKNASSTGLSMRTRKLLFKAACKYIDINKDILIFGGDQWSIPSSSERFIAIQHGVAWDYLGRAKWAYRRWISGTHIGAYFKKARLRWRALRDFGNCRNRVCVDYCFPLWHRTQTSVNLPGRTWVIPNFGHIVPRHIFESRDYEDSDIGIICARRFEVFRGVKMMAHVAKTLLNNYNNIRFTFAGNGSLENWLKDYFRADSRVTITKYLPHESPDIHLRHQIAVVPSFASEGTTLSVAEAMGAGCAVIATPIGGITNMIIDRYNGLFFSPDEESLQKCLTDLINTKQLRMTLGHRGYETAEHAFSIDRWKEDWKNVLNTVAEK